MTEPHPSILKMFEGMRVQELTKSGTPAEEAHRKAVNEAMEIIRKTFEREEK